MHNESTPVAAREAHVGFFERGARRVDQLLRRLRSYGDMWCHVTHVGFFEHGAQRVDQLLRRLLRVFALALHRLRLRDDDIHHRMKSCADAWDCVTPRLRSRAACVGCAITWRHMTWHDVVLHLFGLAIIGCG